MRRRFRRRRIRHGGDLQGGVICRRCNAKSVNLAGGELRGGEIGAVILSAEISEAVKCGRPNSFSAIKSEDSEALFVKFLSSSLEADDVFHNMCFCFSIRSSIILTKI